MSIIHSVEKGECLASIAQRYGLTDWRTIYNDPNNADFRRERPNPNVIFPGDRLTIPERSARDESGATEKRHRFQVSLQKTLLRLVLEDDEGRAFSGKKYRLEVGDRALEGRTKDDGSIEEQVEAEAEEGELNLWAHDEAQGTPYKWRLKIGWLDPVECISGAQARVKNLGFDCGPVDGIAGPKTKSAIRAFQTAYALTVDGIAGPQTQAKLAEVHGC